MVKNKLCKFQRILKKIDYPFQNIELFKECVLYWTGLYPAKCIADFKMEHN
jgi:hypothetical protein